MPHPVDDQGLDVLRDDGHQILCGALDGGVVARDSDTGRILSLGCRCEYVARTVDRAGHTCSSVVERNKTDRSPLLASRR